MFQPIHYVLLSLQGALINAVTPGLRAVTIDLDEINHERLPCFFYDGELSEELLDLSSCILVEVETGTVEHYYCREQILRLDFPEKIPIRGKVAFLRNEPTLPEFKKEGRAFLLEDTPPLAVFRLDMQEALLGKVTPALRHVSVAVNPDEKKLFAFFIYDGEISEKDFKLANAAIQESRGSFPEYTMDSFIERIDSPNDFPDERKIPDAWLASDRWAAYMRQEFKY